MVYGRGDSDYRVGVFVYKKEAEQLRYCLWLGLLNRPPQNGPLESRMQEPVTQNLNPNTKP